MPQVVGVKFRNSAKVYYFSSKGLSDLEPGDYVIVETARGQASGVITFSPREVPEKEIPGQLKGILRRATAVDLTDMERYQQREKQALYRCRAKVSEVGLPMKVIRAEYSFDGAYLTFFFAAEKRVDFRALVKDLARTFKARIELRQVGVRDESALLRDVDDRVQANLDSDGQAAGSSPEPDGDIGYVRAPVVLPGL